MSEKNSRLFRQVLGLKDEQTQGYKRIRRPNGKVTVVCTGPRANYKRMKRVLKEMKRTDPAEYAAVLAGMREQVYGEST